MAERRGFVASLPWVLCAVSLIVLTAAAWLRWQFPDPQEDWLTGTVSGLGFIGFAVVGALIASRLPGNVYGWLWCAAGLIYGVTDGARPFVRWIDGPSWVAWLVGGAGFLSLLALVFFVFLLFPTGRLPSPGWRWLAGVAVVLPIVVFLAVLLIADPDHPDTAPPWALRGESARTVSRLAESGLLLMFLIVVAGMVSTVLRFRRAGPVERRQLAWFMYAAVVNGVLLVLDTVGWLPYNLLFSVLSEACLLLLPAAVGIAVLRYRLYEIDRIVSRSVSYGLLSAVLVGLYFVLVALLRPLLEPLTGSSALAVAGSTLAVAAAFNPFRHRLQTAVDRRFDRARYDAGREVDAFAARLRNEVDLDQVVGGLHTTVAATVAPTRVGVWLRNPVGLR